MNDKRELSEFAQKVLMGLDKVGERLLEEKKRTGSKLVTMLDGEIVHLTVDEYLKLKEEGKF
jgi:hypothetical protein